MINFYWYSKCSTCKKAKNWLDEHGVTYHLIDLIEETPKAEEFIEWMDKNDYPIQKFFNTSGIIYRTENLKEKIYDLTDKEAAQLLSERGMLVKRPILEQDGKIFTGFKESEYETIL